MDYKDIYSRSYMKSYDPHFYDDKQFAYDTMREWLHEVASFSYVRRIFSKLQLDDDLEELTYELVNPIESPTISTESNDDFVRKLFTDGFVICWMRPKVDSILNLSLAFGGKEEKRILSNYSANLNRLRTLEIQHKKYVRSHGYDFGTYGME